ncbi:MAG: pyridoxal 5'-phosphate synthase glutaminase subunit PdxT [Tenericutes bacterium HGW-Tenericutes-3]|nr:MAG: pyridoxal 5'-phosphate synthase glutaminase subunit PdxT [Tenericutes bacterium HGW-Tenericutes-3]
MKVGILAVQGAFIEHAKVLAKLGVESFEIRQKKDLTQAFDGLILPGGESTAMGLLLHELDLFGDLKQRITNGLPVLGTCAGMILLAKHLTGTNQTHLKTMDIEVLRNAYGRQLGSFITNEKFNDQVISMTFIRAPYVSSVGKDVQVLSVVDGKIVAARQQNQLATAFHPELSNSTYVHEYFLQMIIDNQNNQ